MPTIKIGSKWKLSYFLKISICSPIDDDLVEISKSLLLGKRGDNVDTIKYAFTRLSFTLKEYDILEKFGEREAPIFLLDHMLNNTTPNKPTFYCGLGLKKKTLWYQKKRDALKIDPIEKPDEKPGNQNDKSIVNRLSLELATRCGLAERKRIPHDPKKDPTMVPGRSPFYRYIKEKKKPLKVISDNTTAHRTGIFMRFFLICLNIVPFIRRLYKLSSLPITRY